MAEIDRATGMTKTIEKDKRKRSINEVQNSSLTHTKTPAIKNQLKSYQEK